VKTKRPPRRPFRLGHANVYPPRRSSVTSPRQRSSQTAASAGGVVSLYPRKDVLSRRRVAMLLLEMCHERIRKGGGIGL